MCPIVLLLEAWLARSADPHARTVEVDYRVAPGLARMDGNWSALFAASDGTVYIGLAYHGVDGHFASYDPTARANCPLSP